MAITVFLADDNLLIREGVKTLIRMVTAQAHEKGRKVGLCGQAPSDYPEYAEFLAETGLDSVSVTPDALPEVVRRLARS